LKCFLFLNILDEVTEVPIMSLDTLLHALIVASFNVVNKV